MNRIFIYLTGLIVIIFILTGCGEASAELKKDTKNIADVMCKNIEAMNKLRAANQNDSLQLAKLQMEAKQVQIEMTILYQEFKDKYKKKITDEKFKKSFAKELRQAMIDCPYLSAKDREQFEKETE